MTIETADRDAVQPLLNHLPNCSGINGRAGVGVADSAVGPVQGVDICLVFQGATARTCVTVSTGAVNGPVVVRRLRCMFRGAARMAVIAGIIIRIGRGHFVPDLTIAVP